ncbi:phage tail protein I [Altericroceibacterium endophyticum]|uniref:Phage tail protein I n=1 Tax=Altericroceibacterium endophyticum TaxID=1808508 RepID=A0A6I4T8B4_9SPHN|nr:phage tail protein I [Altericroceibacterium endophyticum]MXO66253.1 phage tail protein I [Altericroceibacterium endophyticum]
MAPVPSLLPNSSTAFERAIEQVIGSRQLMSADLISAPLDPDRCPAHLLGFLAWAKSLEIWDDDWSETKKRGTIRNAVRLHRLKTTPAGIRDHLQLVDAELLDLVRPPATPYLARGLNDAAREAWLDGLPQLRIYPFARRSTARPGQIFLSRPLHRAFLADQAGRGAHARFLLTSRGVANRGQRASFVDGGVTHDTTLSDTGDGGTRVTIRRTADRAFYGHSHLGVFLRKSRAHDSLLSFRVAMDGPARALSPGLNATDIRPRRIHQRRSAQRARGFLGRLHLGDRSAFLPASEGPMLVYDRIAFAVPGRPLPRIQATTFLGRDRLGIAPFTAEMRIGIPAKRPPALARHFYGHAVLWKASTARFTRALEAIRVSKALRDTIRVTSTTHRPVAFTPSLRFGEFMFGEIRKVA